MSGAPAFEQELLEVAVELCELGGGILMERYRGARQQGVSAKTTPTDLVSDADRASEQAIVGRLSELRPDDGVLAEEGAARDGKSGLTWVVDPLDGTINFLFGIPQWCVSVAVQEVDGDAVAGAILDPCRGELWEARAGGGATLNGEPISASDQEDLAEAMVATGFAYDAEVRSAQGPVAARLVSKVRDLRRLGSAALDLAWTAAGRYDAYFERSVQPWDIAAGVLICTRAGLEVTELPESGILPWGVLAAPPALTEPLRALVA